MNNTLLGNVDVAQSEQPSSRMSLGQKLRFQQEQLLAKAKQAVSDKAATDPNLANNSSFKPQETPSLSQSDLMDKLKKYAPFVVGGLFLLYLVRKNSTI